MGRVFWNMKEIPIPPEGRINHYDGTVSVYYHDPDGRRQKFAIGRAVGETSMHPNLNFKFHYPELWSKYYDEPGDMAYSLAAGLYVTTLAIGWKVGLYPVVQDSFGPEFGNVLMDCGVFNIEERSDATALFTENMKQRLCFSRMRRSESWMSEMFSQGITEDMVRKFQLAWIDRCVREGASKVWLCIDGTNIDCTATGSMLAEHGHSKSGRSTPVVSFITAVNAETGMPVTWSTYNGSMNDSKAFAEIFNDLARSGLKIEGIIIDRGFACKPVLDLVESFGIDYAVMLKSSSSGYREMLRRHAGQIRWDSRYCIDEKGVFGTTDRVKVFAGSEKDSCVALLYDALNGTERSLRVIFKVWRACLEVRRQLPVPLEQLKIPAGMEKYLQVEVKDGQAASVSFNHENWQFSINARGFCAIASSRERTAGEILHLYRLRVAVEKQFSMVKSQLGYDVARVHSDQSIRNKLAACFIASILRTELMQACSRLDLNTNCMICRLNDLSLIRSPENIYFFPDKIQENLKGLLKEFGVLPNHFHKLAEEFNRQLSNTVYSQTRKLPSLEPEISQGKGRPKTKKPEEPDKPKRRPGRPKGSKNRKTLEREALQAAAPQEPPAEKRRPGRPKGSRNKKTLEREAQAAAGIEAKPRGRGRPKGSKNRKTLEREAQEAAARLAAGKRGRGRPKGSKNKKKVEAEPSSPHGQEPMSTGVVPTNEPVEGASQSKNIQTE